MRSAYKALGAALLASIVFAACGGGGGGGGGTGGSGGGGVNPPTPPSTSSGTATIGGSPSTVTLATISNGSSGSVVFPAATTGSGSATVTLQGSLPSNVAAPAGANAHAAKGGHFAICTPACPSGTFTVLDYVIVNTPAATITFPTIPTFTLTFPSALSGNVYLAVFDTASSSNGWNIIATGTVSGATATFTGQGPVTVPGSDTLVFAIISSSTTLPKTPTPMPSPTQTPTSAPTTNPNASSSPLAGPTYYPSHNGVWAATAVASQLQFPVQSGYGGSGQTIGIVIDAPPNQTWLNTYLTNNLVTRTGSVTGVAIDGGCASQCQGGDEGALDLQTIAALAPGANINVYYIDQLSSNLINDAYAQAVSDNASVVSSSFGGCDTGWPISGTASIFASGAQKGIAFIASSGDQGNECFAGQNQQHDVYNVGPSYPATDKNVIGVGGTETSIASGHALTTNTLWQDTVDGGLAFSASGGGVSSAVSLPSYQQGLAGVSGSGRNSPDVSMPAEDTYVQESSPLGFLGTSWSAPQFAAMMAEVYQYCGSRSNNPAALPYVAYAMNPAAFIDVNNGANNQWQGGSTLTPPTSPQSPYYTAVNGYDAASGLGVPKGMAFATTVCPNHAPVASYRGIARDAFVQHTMPADTPVDIRPHVVGLQDLGRRQASAMTDVQVVIANGNVSGESEVVGYLTAHGFTITKTFASHLVVDARGPASAVESVFRTQLHDYVQANTTHYATATAIALPSEIANNATGVVLDNLIVAHHGPQRRF